MKDWLTETYRLAAALLNFLATTQPRLLKQLETQSAQSSTWATAQAQVLQDPEGGEAGGAGGWGTKQVAETVRDRDK